MKKLVLIVIVALWAVASVSAQGAKYGTYYDQRESLFAAMPTSPDDIIFLGNSITDGGEWAEMFGDVRMKNRGISGDITEGVYDRLGTIVKGRPAKIFILIGVNDINNKLPLEVTVANMEKIIDKIQAESPKTKVYLQSLFPMNDCFNMFLGHTKFPDKALGINAEYRRIAKEKGVEYVDIFTPFADADGKMKVEYTNDGLHLNGAGYVRWAEVLRPYVEQK